MLCRSVHTAAAVQFARTHASQPSGGSAPRKQQAGQVLQQCSLRHELPGAGGGGVGPGQAPHGAGGGVGSGVQITPSNCKDAFRAQNAAPGGCEQSSEYLQKRPARGPREKSRPCPLNG